MPEMNFYLVLAVGWDGRMCQRLQPLREGGTTADGGRRIRPHGARAEGRVQAHPPIISFGI